MSKSASLITTFKDLRVPVNYYRKKSKESKSAKLKLISNHTLQIFFYYISYFFVALQVSISSITENIDYKVSLNSKNSSEHLNRHGKKNKITIQQLPRMVHNTRYPKPETRNPIPNTEFRSPIFDPRTSISNLSSPTISDPLIFDHYHRSHIFDLRSSIYDPRSLSPESRAPSPEPDSQSQIFN